jgi:glycosyltransferase involved in cell wall biosynthesis
MNKPRVTVCLITYNQLPFLPDALLGIERQKNEHFDVELVISDDCSVDGTVEHLTGFARSQGSEPPTAMLLADSNIGMHGNWVKALSSCQGDYVATLEGDDYWLTEDKLQKQVQLLESNPNAVACFSNAKVLAADGSFSQYNYVDKYAHDLYASEFFSLNLNPIPTCTVVFRRSAFQGFSESYYNSPFADWILHSVLMMKGHYVFLNETTSVYRQHQGGVWTGIAQEKQLLNKLKALKVIRQIVGKKYAKYNHEAIRKQLDALLYHYRSESQWLKYLESWLELKRL